MYYNLSSGKEQYNMKNGKEHLFGFGNCVILSIKEDKNIRG